MIVCCHTSIFLIGKYTRLITTRAGPVEITVFTFVNSNTTRKNWVDDVSISINPINNVFHVLFRFLNIIRNRNTLSKRSATHDVTEMFVRTIPRQICVRVHDQMIQMLVDWDESPVVFSVLLGSFVEDF